MVSQEFFHSHKLSGRATALGSTQRLTEMGTNLPPSFADCLEIWTPQPRGTFRAYNRPEQGKIYLKQFSKADVRFQCYLNLLEKQILLIYSFVRHWKLGRKISTENSLKCDI